MPFGAHRGEEESTSDEPPESIRDYRKHAQQESAPLLPKAQFLEREALRPEPLPLFCASRRLQTPAHHVPLAHIASATHQLLRLIGDQKAKEGCGLWIGRA